MLLLDECAGDHSLREALSAAGHDVVLALEALGAGADDADLLAYACEHGRAIVTTNGLDFGALCAEAPNHPGLILIVRDDEQNDLKTPDIVRALARVGSAHGAGIAGKTIVLNAYHVADPF